MKKTKEDLWYYFSISKDMLMEVSYTSSNKMGISSL